MKLRVLVASCLIPLAALAPALTKSAKASPICDLRPRFQTIVHDVLGVARAESSSSFSLSVLDPASGETLCEDSVQENRNIYPASTIKTLIAMAVLRRMDRGEIDLGDRIEITQSNANAECKHSSCARYGKGKVRTVAELLNDMITVSNNIAANQLIDLATKPFINETAGLVDSPELRVFRKVYDDVDPEPEIKTPNRATSAAFGRLYQEIATGRLGILSPRARDHLIGLLRAQKINGSLNGNFPKNVIFFHKTGNTSKVTGDGGFFILPSGRIAVLVGLQDFNQFKDCPKCATRTGFETLREIGKKALELTLEIDAATPLD